MKLRRQDIVNYVNDWEYLEIDFYLIFMCYLVVSGGILKTQIELEKKSANFFQPKLAALKGSGAATKV